MVFILRVRSVFQHWLLLALVTSTPWSVAASEANPKNLLALLAPETTVGLVEATSQTLLRGGQIDFPLSVDVDLPIGAKRVSLDAALNPQSEAPRYVIVFEVALAKASRRVLGLKPVESTLFLGYSGQPYVIADDDSATDYIPGQQGVSSLVPHQGIVNDSGPVGTPLIFAYAFDKAKIQARRTMTVNTYVIDRARQTYVKSTFDYSEQQRFEVAYRISRYDPKRKQHAKNHDKEKDVDAFEKQGAAVKLSALLKDYAAKRDEARPITSALALRNEIFKSRNAALAQINANTFDDRPLNDPRFDSVVAVYAGKGPMGSGFYVTPDVVMTNWHVVDEHAFVEMKTYDGRETFGTLLGRDARLDIALVKVQDRGRPVAFYTGRNIDLGTSVEAIGHPHRLEFSITRGIVSAVRKHHSINLPSYAGDKVLYIQTDAPINRGNSGGPLFLGNRVVGMNTWAIKKHIAEGLNFSVHYSELLNFMNEHLPGFTVPPGGDS